MGDPVSKALAAAAAALWVARRSTETVRYDLARAAVMAFLRALPNGSPAGLTTEVNGVTFWNASTLAGTVARAEAVSLGEAPLRLRDGCRHGEVLNCPEETSPRPADTSPITSRSCT